MQHVYGIWRTCLRQLAYVAPPYGVDVSANWRNNRHLGAGRPKVATAPACFQGFPCCYAGPEAQRLFLLRCRLAEAQLRSRDETEEGTKGAAPSITASGTADFCQNRIRFPAVDTYLKIAIVSIMGDA